MFGLFIPVHVLTHWACALYLHTLVNHMVDTCHGTLSLENNLEIIPVLDDIYLPASSE